MGPKRLGGIALSHRLDAGKSFDLSQEPGVRIEVGEEKMDALGLIVRGMK